MLKNIIALSLLASSLCSSLMAETYKIDLERICKKNNDITKTILFNYIVEKGIETYNYVNENNNSEKGCSLLLTKENTIVIKYNLIEREVKIHEISLDTILDLNQKIILESSESSNNEECILTLEVKKYNKI